MLFHRFLLWWLGAIGLLTLLQGCTIQPAGFPAEMADGFRAFYASALDQTIWDKISGEGEGHITHPGLRTGAGLEYFAEVRLVGVDGEVELGATGFGTGQLTPEARSAILELLRNDTHLSPGMRAALIDWLQRRLSPAPAPAPVQ